MEWRVTGYTGRTANVGSKYPLESISQNIRDDYECRATGCTVRTPSVGGWVPIGVYKLTKGDMVELQL